MECRDVTGFESPKCTMQNYDVKTQQGTEKGANRKHQFLKAVSKTSNCCNPA